MPSSATMRYSLNSVRDEMGATLRKWKFLIRSQILGQAFFLSTDTSRLCAAEKLRSCSLSISQQMILNRLALRDLDFIQLVYYSYSVIQHIYQVCLHCFDSQRLSVDHAVTDRSRRCQSFDTATTPAVFPSIARATSHFCQLVLCSIMQVSMILKIALPFLWLSRYLQHGRSSSVLFC